MPEATIGPTPCVWMGHFHELPDGPWEIGWMFYGLGHYLSDRYRDETAAGRPPITVICPCLHHWDDGSRPDRLAGTVFCIDSYPRPDDGPHDPSKHWELTVDLESLIVGQQPMVTVHPSIHLVGIWHGWLQNGVLHQ